MKSRLYPCNKEFEKTIKYNNHWFRLKSIFDNDLNLSSSIQKTLLPQFNFNQTVVDNLNDDLNTF